MAETERCESRPCPQLLPCPFCGGSPKTDRGYLGFFSIWCGNEGCFWGGAASGSEDKATAQWNKRAPASETAPTAPAAPAREAVLDALRELVRLKDMADRNADWPNLQGDMDEREEYRRCKPLAWAAARAALKDKP